MLMREMDNWSGDRRKIFTANVRSQVRDSGTCGTLHDGPGSTGQRSGQTNDNQALSGAGKRNGSFSRRSKFKPVDILLDLEAAKRDYWRRCPARSLGSAEEDDQDSSQGPNDPVKFNIGDSHKDTDGLSTPDVFTSGSDCQTRQHGSVRVDEPLSVGDHLGHRDDRLRHSLPVQSLYDTTCNPRTNTREVLNDRALSDEDVFFDNSACTTQSYCNVPEVGDVNMAVSSNEYPNQHSAECGTLSLHTSSSEPLRTSKPRRSLSDLGSMAGTPRPRSKCTSRMASLLENLTFRQRLASTLSISPSHKKFTDIVNERLMTSLDVSPAGPLGRACRRTNCLSRSTSDLGALQNRDSDMEIENLASHRASWITNNISQDCGSVSLTNHQSDNKTRQQETPEFANKTMTTHDCEQDRRKALSEDFTLPSFEEFKTMKRLGQGSPMPKSATCFEFKSQMQNYDTIFEEDDSLSCSKNISHPQSGSYASQPDHLSSLRDSAKKEPVKVKRSKCHDLHKSVESAEVKRPLTDSLSERRTYYSTAKQPDSAVLGNCGDLHNNDVDTSNYCDRPTIGWKAGGNTGEYFALKPDNDDDGERDDGIESDIENLENVFLTPYSRSHSKGHGLENADSGLELNVKHSPSEYGASPQFDPRWPQMPLSESAELSEDISVLRTRSDVSDIKAEENRKKATREKRLKPYKSDPLGAGQRRPDEASQGGDTQWRRTASEEDILKVLEESGSCDLRSRSSSEESPEREQVALNSGQCQDCGVWLPSRNPPDICQQCQVARHERRKVITEVVETEDNYGNDLKIIRDEFYQPVQTSGLLSPDQIQTLFNNLQELISISEHLSSMLHAALQQATEAGDEDYTTVHVGKIFLGLSDMLLAFETYCTSQSTAPVLLEQLLEEKPLLRIYLEVSRQEKACLRKMGLKDFLMLPVQRIMKYPLLLGRLHKDTPLNHPDRANSSCAQSKIEVMLGLINAKAKGTGTLRMKRRPSSLRKSSGGDSMENIELQKAAMECLGWNRNETHFVRMGAVQFALLSDGTSTKRGKAQTLKPSLAVIATLGKCVAYQLEQTRSSLSADGNNLQNAALVLVREKSGRLVALRDPLFLGHCIICQDQECDDFLEIHEANKEAYLLKAESQADTHLWFKHLKMVSESLGRWRHRRKARANIWDGATLLIGDE